FRLLSREESFYDEGERTSCAPPPLLRVKKRRDGLYYETNQEILRMTLLKRRRWFIMAIFLIIVYLSPLFILGKDAHVRVHDQLDSSVIWYEMLANSGKLFAANDAVIPDMMNGLPRISLPTQFEWLVWLFVVFPPFVAFTINAVLVRFV